MYRQAIVIGTMLLPTRGHLALIEFASRISYSTSVLIQGRAFEPIPVQQRAEAIRDATKNLHEVSVFGYNNDAAPQNPNPRLETFPGGDKKFWEFWRDDILASAAYRPTEDDVIVSSEPYGAVLAEYLGCHFMPFDINREIYDIKGSSTRKVIYGSGWNKILPEFRKHLKVNVVMFGQESVGKTTLARAIGSQRNMQFIPEYARGYLEAPSIGTEINKAKMKDIAMGQLALESIALNDPTHMGAAFDTDILSTIGYYRIFLGRYPTEDLKSKHELTRDRKVYILVPDDVPFEEDPLRYGGDKRESTYEFWKDLLDEFRCEYVELPRGLNEKERVEWISHLIWKLREHKIANIEAFERE